MHQNYEHEVFRKLIFNKLCLLQKLDLIVHKHWLKYSKFIFYSSWLSKYQYSFYFLPNDITYMYIWNLKAIILDILIGIHVLNGYVPKLKKKLIHFLRFKIVFLESIEISRTKKSFYKSQKQGNTFPFMVSSNEVKQVK